MQGFSRTYFNHKLKFDYLRLMDTNFEDYGIRKIRKMKLKIKDQEITL